MDTDSHLVGYTANGLYAQFALRSRKEQELLRQGSSPVDPAGLIVAEPALKFLTPIEGCTDPQVLFRNQAVSGIRLFGSELGNLYRGHAEYELAKFQIEYASLGYDIDASFPNFREFLGLTDIRHCRQTRSKSFYNYAFRSLHGVIVVRVSFRIKSNPGIFHTSVTKWPETFTNRWMRIKNDYGSIDSFSFVSFLSLLVVGLMRRRRGGFTLMRHRPKVFS